MTNKEPHKIEQRAFNDIIVSILPQGNALIEQGLSESIIIEKDKIDLVIIALTNLK